MIVTPESLSDTPENAMPQLNDLLHSISLTGGVFLDAEFTAPWCVSAKIGPEDCATFGPLPGSIIAFHYVHEGQLCVTMEGQAPVAIAAGEIVLLPRNDHHHLANGAEVTAVSADDLMEPGAEGALARIRHGGGGELTRIICGFLGSEHTSSPLLMLLPPIMKLAVPEGAWANWFDSSFKLAAQHSATGATGRSTTLVKISEILFLDAINRYLEEFAPPESGRVAGIDDPKICRALGLLQERMRHRWAADELARAVGMSRSAFAERFARVVGEPPMRYLTRLRLHAAARRLRQTKDSLARIAFDIGYESEAAFSRAFKREFGEPPASWRDTGVGGGGASRRTVKTGS
jgi:AraC-like DNA-binding protein